MVSQSRQAVVLCTFAVALLVAGVSAPSVAGSSPGATQAPVDCSADSGGAVFSTDSGLVVDYSGQSLDRNPFRNETVLALPTATISAADNASAVLVPTNRAGVCLRTIEPTDSPIVVVPGTGPTVTVRDPLRTLAVSPVNYSRTATGTELLANASTTASITIADPTLELGRTVEAVDATGARLAAGRVTDNGTLSLSLPTGDHRMDLRYVPVETPTATPDPTDAPPTGGVESGTDTPTQTPTPTSTPTSRRISRGPDPVRPEPTPSTSGRRAVSDW